MLNRQTIDVVSTHSRPKAAGWLLSLKGEKGEFQLTAARRRLDSKLNLWRSVWQFQLTAARRRLGALPAKDAPIRRFNSQPPEGGW